MRAFRMIPVALAALLLGTAVGTVAALGQEEDEGLPPGAPASHDPAVPSQQHDMGTGEHLVLVVGGVFPSADEAERAAARMTFGELQGYYVAPVGQFAGLGSVLGARSSDAALVSAFRTEEGAREFLELALAAGAPGLVTPRLENLGGVYVGLGQEAAPDGSGPLWGPLPGVSAP